MLIFVPGIDLLERIWVEFSILGEESREILFSGSHPRAVEVLVGL